MFLNSLLLLLLFPFCTSIDTLTPNQYITDGNSLISKGNNFELGFFSPGNSRFRYLGIWYVKVSEASVVWVGNRNSPINDSSGAISIDRFGNLVLNNSRDHNIWSTNVTVKNSTVAQILDSGNLVLVEDGSKRVVWQSFDYPTHTLLPGMKIGIVRKKGLDLFLTSWKSRDDPAMGAYSCRLNPSGSPQVFLYKGSTPYWRSFPWPWAIRSMTRLTDLTPTYVHNYSFVSNEDEISITSNLYASIITRSVIDESGSLQVFFWQDGERQWKELWSGPKYQCDQYGHCGANSKCNGNYYSNMLECTCLPGYKLKSPRNSSNGCIRKGVSVCGKGEGFVKMGPLKVPDSSNAAWVDMGLSSANCEQACLKNCSCTAFSIIDIAGKGSSCLAWYGELMDTQENAEDGREIHVRVDETELVENVRKSKKFLEEKGNIAIPIIFAAQALFLVVLFIYFGLMKKRKMKGAMERALWEQFDFTGSTTCSEDSFVGNELEESRRNPDLSIFSLSTIVVATNNFSPATKLGQGGFGSVYKGELSSGKEIAVKRLCKSSGQGIKEFKTEVMSIAKLQHRNLVKLLGCCIEGEEKMLIYEYMPNKSLNSFIFDQTRKLLLDWRKRFEIIVGIARGILYLHQDSRLRIIHRDLKASNILLDADMNPKISDFGLARIFRGDQTQDKTRIVVGTYGYMSPEYAAFGKFSIKSDVFSFGVILLEIISGKKNNDAFQGGPYMNLIGNVWDLWREDKALEIVDSSLKESCTPKVLRCIQIGLLCVEEDATDRPTMLEVVLMLNSEIALPSPKQPAFIFKRNDNDSDSLRAAGRCWSINDVSISTTEGR